ncbi:CHAT domain-containing protein [Fischerella thermalis]|uniref:CHAT domain-containing protein n=1 Tax=Fischerella thermalis TaxID=372787 RepID=UPI0019E071D4|nr:CHAT domain-containing protein [Fischerella thermalis]MBF1988564.1 CHAT domain-containing protein [Fischerella thermalis M58_A2018_009]MBF2058984.1 CHAT domain-containing protein [Fischerella thermalis M66_A2018_004]
MHPPQLYSKIVTATVVFTLGSEMVFSQTTLVTANTIIQNRYTEITQSFIKNTSRSEQIKQLNQEAMRLSRQNRFQDASPKLETALAISRDIQERPLEAATFNNIGRVYQQQGKFPQAFNSYLQALAINKELSINEKTPGQAHIALGKTYSNLGYLSELQNQPELAIFFYKHCVNNREKVRLNPAAFTGEQLDAYDLTVTQTYYALGEELLKSDRTTEGQRILDLIKVEELEEYLQNVQGNQLTAKGIEITPPEKLIKQKLDQSLDSAVVLGKELTKLRQIPPEKRSLQQKQRIQQIAENQQKILDEFNNFINRPDVKAQLEQISRTARRQNLDLESLNAIRDNLARLPEKSVILYPLVLENSLELVLVSPDSPPIHRTVAVKKENLHQTILNFRKALENLSLDVKKPARQLYDWLIKPIEKDLTQAATQTIVYAPDGQLRYIPLAALFDGKQWLVQRYSINHITAASLTNFNTPPSSDLRILAAAFTKGSYTVEVANRKEIFSGLPFAAKEVENLATIVPGTKKILDNAFNPQTTVPQMDDFTTVHMATHAAFVVGKPEDSFILFGNGERVTLKDIATWSLPRVDLVVLSACETGLGGKLGNGEEILGFGYQMQKTGARSAIASLWAVDDGGTQALMSVFYALLPSGKLTKAEVLRQAQIALITGSSSQLGQQQDRIDSIPKSTVVSLSHPYYWAPFILIGNGL